MSGQNPRAVRGSYCLKITQKKLLSLWLALLFLLMGGLAGIYGCMELVADKSDWSYMEYIKLAAGWLCVILLTASGIGTAYTAVRDAFWPQKSTLARSIRSQLPYPDSAPEVGELFAMVDKDIEANGQWFDKVAVGKEWVLGDEANYIPRIRLFFGRDEIRTHTSGERTNTSRIVELHILDDRKQRHIYTLRNPRELQPLLDCISLRTPDALCRPYRECASWCQKSDMEWADMLREYRVRQGEREMAAFGAGSGGMATDQNMVLTFPDGDVTSRVTPDLVHQALMDCLKQGEGTLLLTPGCPVIRGDVRYMEMECFAAFYEEIDEPAASEMEDFGEANLLLKMTSVKDGRTLCQGKAIWTDIRSAEEILRAWLQGALPDLEKWEDVKFFEKGERQKKQEIIPPHLGLMTTQGVFQSHERFTVEDVEVAAEGLEDGTYQLIDLTLPGGYLWMRIQGGDKTDGRCKVSVTRADSDKLRYFKNQCTHKQAAVWLTEFAKGAFHPDWKEWKDYTRQAEKEYKKK